jgi:hypothetical protein
VTDITPGWGKPHDTVSRKWHWFAIDGRSLCGKVGFYRGATELGNDDSSDNCAECRKRLVRSRAQRREAEP